MRERLGRAYRGFFFEATPGRAEAWFRVGYACVLLLEQLELSQKLELLFSNQGVHPRTPLDVMYPLGLVQVVFGVWVGAALFLALGVRVRAAGLVNLLLLVYFFGLRGFAAPHAADWLLHASGFYLAFMHSDARLSIDRHFGWARPARVYAWPKRLAQLNLVSVYFTAGLAKLADPAWIAGRAFGDTLKHPLLTHFTPALAFTSPRLLSVVDWAIVVWELGFPVLIALRRFRTWGLLSALLFNLGVWFTLRVGLFTVMATVSLLLFVDDPPFRAPEKPGSGAREPKASPGVAQRVRVFVVGHLALLGLAFAGYLFTGLGLPAVGRLLAGVPLVSAYTRGVAGFAYYDVWNSRFFLEPVRLIYYEATSPDGKSGPIEPFDAQGAFRPGWRYFTEAREGLLSVRLALAPVEPRVWAAYAVYLVRKYRRDYAWPCPAAIRIYRIAGPLDEFGTEPKDLRVSRQLLVTATPRCIGRAIDPEVSLNFASPRTSASPRTNSLDLNSKAGR